jgi:hypothetical protein
MRELENARQILNAAMETLKITSTVVTLTELLTAADINRQDYTLAIKSYLKRPSIILKRAH